MTRKEWRQIWGVEIRLNNSDVRLNTKAAS